MVAPFILGGFLALWIRRVPGLFSEKATDFEAVLFLGAAMSITAFPMLARIIYERGITGTPGIDGVDHPQYRFAEGHYRRLGISLGGTALKS
jgi:hypothetical protein